MVYNRLVFGFLGLLTCVVLVSCRDFYMGMFKRNDILVAQDRVFKERAPYKRMYAKYLKVVRCPITYLRVVDRIGVGSGPTVRIVRGGLRKNHIYLYLISAYNLPLSVAIYIGCPRSKLTTTTTEAVTVNPSATTVANGSGSGNVSDVPGNGTGSSEPGAAPTTVAAPPP